MLLDGVQVSPGHQFWPDDLSPADRLVFPALPTSKHLTALYLLGLAVKHGARFVTFDHSIDASILPGGPAAYFPSVASLNVVVPVGNTARSGLGFPQSLFVRSSGHFLFGGQAVNFWALSWGQP